MGRKLAQDLVENVLDIHTSIAIQLRSNHYPPVPLTMVEPCIHAIYAVSDGDLDLQIKLPDGVKWRGKSYAPASAIVESHHLEPWCTWDMDDDA